jgi:hypothetical protein
VLAQLDTIRFSEPTPPPSGKHTTGSEAGSRAIPPADDLRSNPNTRNLRRRGCKKARCWASCILGGLGVIRLMADTTPGLTAGIAAPHRNRPRITAVNRGRLRPGDRGRPNHATWCPASPHDLPCVQPLIFAAGCCWFAVVSRGCWWVCWPRLPSNAGATFPQVVCKRRYEWVASPRWREGPFPTALDGQ